MTWKTPRDIRGHTRPTKVLLLSLPPSLRLLIRPQGTTASSYKRVSLFASGGVHAADGSEDGAPSVHDARAVS